MTDTRAAKLWAINVTAFILLFILTVTGLVNWLLLPRGFAGGANALAALRHFLREIHAWTAVLFLISMAVHWMLHWPYLRSNLRRHGLLK